MTDAPLLQLHALSTLMMAGVIWFVQIVHYPMFALLNGPGFTQYAEVHQKRATVVVAPLMLIEAATATWLVVMPVEGISPLLAWSGLALVLVAWISTALLQVPCHTRLAQAFDTLTIRWLVVSNWVRTIAWSARGVLSLTFLTASSA